MLGTAEGEGVQGSVQRMDERGGEQTKMVGLSLHITMPPVGIFLPQHHQHLSLSEAQLVMVVCLTVVHRLDTAQPGPGQRSAWEGMGSRSVVGRASVGIQAEGVWVGG